MTQMQNDQGMFFFLLTRQGTIGMVKSEDDPTVGQGRQKEKDRQGYAGESRRWRSTR